MYVNQSRTVRLRLPSTTAHIEVTLSSYPPISSRTATKYIGLRPSVFYHRIFVLVFEHQMITEEQRTSIIIFTYV